MNPWEKNWGAQADSTPANLPPWEKDWSVKSTTPSAEPVDTELISIPLEKLRQEGKLSPSHVVGPDSEDIPLWVKTADDLVKYRKEKTYKPGERVEAWLSPVHDKPLEGTVSPDGKSVLLKKGSVDPLLAASITAGLNAPAAATFLGTMGALAPLADAIPGVGRLAKVARFATPILGGLGASAGVGMGQRALTQKVAPGINEIEQQVREGSPGGSLVGGLAASGFTVGKPTWEGVATEIRKRAVPAAVGAGIQLPIELATAPEGELIGKGGLGRIAEQAVVNAALDRMTTTGQALFAAGSKLGKAVAPVRKPSVSYTSKADAAIAEAKKLGGTDKAAEAAAQPIAMEDVSGLAGPEAKPPILEGVGVGGRGVEDIVDITKPRATIEALTKPMDKTIAEIAKFAESRALREDPASVRENLSKLGLNAEEAAGVFEAARLADETAAAELKLLQVHPETYGEKQRLLKRISDIAWEAKMAGIYRREGGRQMAEAAQDMKAEQAATSRQYAKWLDEARAEERSQVEYEAKRIAKWEELDKRPGLQTKEREKWGIPPRTKTPADERALIDAAKREFKAKIDAAVAEGIHREKPLDVTEFPPTEAKPPLEFGKLPEAQETTTLSQSRPFEVQGGTKTPPEGEMALNPATGAKEGPSGVRAGINAAGEGGFTTPATMAKVAQLASPAIGATIGYQFGDTPEEKKRNAIWGALAMGGGVLGTSVLASLAKSNPRLHTKLIQEGGASGMSSEAGAIINPFFREKKPGIDAPVEAPPPVNKVYEEPPPKEPSLYDQFVGRVDTQVAKDTSAERAVENAAKAWEPGFFDKGPFKFLWTPVDNIRKVYPAVAGVLRNMVQLANEIGSEFYLQNVKPVLAMRKLVGREEFEKLGVMLRSGYEKEVLEALDSTPEGKAIADGLRNGWIKNRQKYLEMFRHVRGGEEKVGEIENYWPLVVHDAKALRKAIGSDAEGMGILEDALAAARKAKGSKLTQDEEAQALANLIQGSMRFPNVPGFIRPRTLDRIKVEWAKYFEPLDVSLDKYGASLADDFSIRKYLGKVEKESKDPWDPNANPDAPIASVIAKGIDEGKINSEGQDIIKENLNAYINRPSGSTFSHWVNSRVGAIQTAGNLGQIHNAIPQLLEVFWTIANRDAISGLRGFGRALAANAPLIGRKGERYLSLEDVNLMEGTPETREFTRSSGWLNKATSIILAPFFKWSDRIGKETFLNATQLWAEKNARRADPASFFTRTARQTKDMFGDDEWQGMLKAMREGDWMDPQLKKFLFNELSNLQAVTRGELPLGMLKASPLGRIPWRLMSFTLRQMGRAKAQTYDEWRSGNKKDAVIYAANYAFWMMVGNSMIQYARDLASGKKETELSDYAFGSLVQMAGLNRVQISQALRGDLTSALADRMAPGFGGPVTDIARDISIPRDVLTGRLPLSNVLQESELVKRAPWIGRWYYDTYGKGARKAAEQARGKPRPGIFQEVEEAVTGSNSTQRR